MIYLAKIIFYGPDRGGRTRAPQSGYHPQLRLGDVYTSCVIYVDDDTDTVFAFDHEHFVRLRLMSPQFYEDRLHVGDTLRWYEGSKQVAEGLLIQIMEDE